ncbi:MAG: tRNA nucleotidyltransferase [Candidatus Magasanikbacteria bacterium CG10_big_fil_rev_8_21_14_0_10_40_10]|uniref:tRNA nucleotidyltransferase n=1 Tax=Candidatus Magasanikbacteria bacterium CG10_big_fil_rev_8_21_14_0_10_40_10 TaxID=1974648 RepID=A0A2M6W4A6_9BACT|nr:MAG: tRNA nucleotidyltransferase [Candidatus Magasanikbacteria bacterium CG10_big_fil_rev_8_21_14_0_10_40_10]
MTLEKIFKIIARLAKKNKTPIYAVGGFVRDFLLGQADFKDIDFVVEGSGIAFAQKLDNELKQVGRLVEFADFDTARYLFLSEDDKIILELEFAGARTEKYNSKSRKPQVLATDLAQDLSRRDFTINAMALPASELIGGLKKIKKSAIIDLFSGRKDLKNKILRTPLDPNVTFSDDPLRMMRAVRFATQLDFSIEELTLRAIYQTRDRIKIVSAERVNEELFKILACSHSSIAFNLMFQTHLLDLVLPEVSALDGVEEIYGQQHKNNLIHTFKVVDNIATRSDKIILRLAGLLHDIGKSQTKKFLPKIGWTFYQHEHVGRKLVYKIARRLRLSKKETDYLAKLVRWHQQPISLMDEGITDSAVRRLIVNLGDELEDLLILGISDITTGNPYKLKKRQANYDHLRARIDEVMAKDKLRAFQSPVRGEEIMAECNLKPGPTVGRIKEAIEEAILDGIIPNEYEPARKYFEEIKAKFLNKASAWEKLAN